MMDTSLFTDRMPVGTLSIFSGNTLHFGPEGPPFDENDSRTLRFPSNQTWKYGRYVLFGQLTTSDSDILFETDTQVVPICAARRRVSDRKTGQSLFRTKLVCQMVKALHANHPQHAIHAVKTYLEILAETK
jgi:hypothetical protein